MFTHNENSGNSGESGLAPSGSQQVEAAAVLLDASSSSTDGEAFIKLTRFHVPSAARIGDSVHLICQYELSGETLHAMKLFKDDKEVSS